jgi:hypothetical protein
LLQPGRRLATHLDTTHAAGLFRHRRCAIGALVSARRPARLCAAAAGLQLSLGGFATACPRCATGEEARRQVWRDDFGDHLAMTVLPFLILGAMSWRLHSIGRKP